MKAKALKNITINQIDYKQGKIYDVEFLEIAWRKFFEAIEVKEDKVIKEPKKEIKTNSKKKRK